MARAVTALKREAPRTAAPRGQAIEIHRVLRDRICLLQYRPGELLVETELAAEFNVSRTPVRQALQRLDYEALSKPRTASVRRSPGLISRNSRMSMHFVCG